MGGARVFKGKKEGKRREGARKRKDKMEGGGRGGKEREQEGDTRHTNPSLLPVPLILLHRYIIR